MAQPVRVIGALITLGCGLAMTGLGVLLVFHAAAHNDPIRLLIALLLAAGGLIVIAHTLD